MDIGQVAFATEERLGIAFLTRQFFLGLDITDHTRESGKIIIDQLLGLRAAAIELLRQTEGGDTVYDTEIGRFGLTALVFGDLLDRQTVDTRRRSRMDILPGTESR